MRYTTWLLTLSLALVWLSARLARAEDAPRATGVVKDATSGKPVQGATVRFKIKGGRKSWEATTDSDGRYNCSLTDAEAPVEITQRVTALLYNASGIQSGTADPTAEMTPTYLSKASKSAVTRHLGKLARRLEDIEKREAWSAASPAASAAAFVEVMDSQRQLSLTRGRLAEMYSPLDPGLRLFDEKAETLTREASRIGEQLELAFTQALQREYGVSRVPEPSGGLGTGPVAVAHRGGNTFQRLLTQVLPVEAARAGIYFKTGQELEGRRATEDLYKHFRVEYATQAGHEASAYKESADVVGKYLRLVRGEEGRDPKRAFQPALAALGAMSAANTLQESSATGLTLTAEARELGVSWFDIASQQSSRSSEVRITGVADDAGVVVIPIGARDGVLAGMTFTVSRGREYVATIVIDTVEEEKAAGRIQRSLSKMAIRKGDRVTLSNK